MYICTYSYKEMCLCMGMYGWCNTVYGNRQAFPESYWMISAITLQLEHEPVLDFPLLNWVVFDYLFAHYIFTDLAFS